MGALGASFDLRNNAYNRRRRGGVGDVGMVDVGRPRETEQAQAWVSEHMPDDSDEKPERRLGEAPAASLTTWTPDGQPPHFRA